MLREKPFDFPAECFIRVIADTDCYCEADDQYCVAHMLMTPRFEMAGLVAEQFGTQNGDDSEQKSYDELQNIVHLMGLDGEVGIYHGAPHALSDVRTPVESEGARLIVREAMKDDTRPLFVCCQGALTNMASSCLMEHAIADRVTVI